MWLAEDRDGGGAGAGIGAQAREELDRATPLECRPCPLDTLGQVGGPTGDEQRRAGVEQYHVASRASLPVEDSLDHRGVLRRAPALELGSRRSGEANVIRV